MTSFFHMVGTWSYGTFLSRYQHHLLSVDLLLRIYLKVHHNPPEDCRLQSVLIAPKPGMSSWLAFTWIASSLFSRPTAQQSSQGPLQPSWSLQVVVTVTMVDDISFITSAWFISQSKYLFNTIYTNTDLYNHKSQGDINVLEVPESTNDDDFTQI